MELRNMKKLGIDVSLLGFGCMRFPMKDGQIDEVEAERMLDSAYKHGVNYFDTAYPYHNGQSEPLVGRILDQYDRHSYYLATKLPVWEVKSLEDAKRIFEEQLKRLNKDYIDFYLLHALNQDRFQAMKELGIIEFCEELQQQGKIKYLGFSFHDSYEVFEEIITHRNWDFCQIQYNYADRNEQAGDKGYALAEALDIPLIIMEPLKGGSLCKFSDDITDMFKALNPDASIPSFGLRWVASHPNVKVILSGMSSWDQVEDNLNTFNHYVPLSKEEETVIEQVDEIIKSRVQNGCTACRYCMPCPAGVDIPRNFRLWNTYHMFQNYNMAKWDWEQQMVDQHCRADQCIQCGACEEQCPQKLHIRDDLVTLTKDLNSPIY